MLWVDEWAILTRRHVHRSHQPVGEKCKWKRRGSRKAGEMEHPACAEKRDGDLSHNCIQDMQNQRQLGEQYRVLPTVEGVGNESQQEGRPKEKNS